MLAQGHTVRLYVYASVDGVPDGVEIADASEVLPQDQIIVHTKGSVALFSDRFRYVLQSRGLGAWIDTDVYLLKPLPSTPYLFGFQDDRWINGAVLRLPTDCPMLPELFALFDDRTVPTWLDPRAAVPAWWRRLTTGKAGLARMPWGTAGPHALTALARKHRLSELALPPRALYPVAYDDAAWIRDPAIDLERVIGPDTLAIHLWNELIRPFKDLPAPAGSFLARLQAEGA